MKLTLKKNDGINNIWMACKNSPMFNSIQAFNVSLTDFSKISAPID